MTATALLVEYIGEEYQLTAGSVLEFGRTAELELDDANPFLHRVCGAIVERAGVWWVDNRGDRLPLLVVSETGARTELPPGASSALNDGTHRIVLNAGRITYEININSISAGAPQPAKESSQPSDRGETTRGWGEIRLNYEQRLLLLALSERRLLNGDLTLPSSKDLGERLGWTVKKVERKLDYMCGRFAEAGVVGLVGVAGIDAGDRRRRLSEHVVRFQLVKSQDLFLLDVESAESESPEAAE